MTVCELAGLHWLGLYRMMKSWGVILDISAFNIGLPRRRSLENVSFIGTNDLLCIVDYLKRKKKKNDG